MVQAVSLLHLNIPWQPGFNADAYVHVKIKLSNQ